LGSVSFPPGITDISDGAFQGCSGLAAVTIPATVASLGDGAFASCTALTAAHFLGSAPTMGTGVFAQAASGFTLTYRNGKTGFTSPTWLGYPAVKVPDPTLITAWLNSKGLPDNADLHSAPNHDGVSLLLAYGLNLDPRQNQGHKMPRPVIAGNQMNLTFYAGNDDVTYAVETSTDMQVWTTTGVSLSAKDANSLRTASVPVTGVPKRFVRLVVRH